MSKNTLVPQTDIVVSVPTKDLTASSGDLANKEDPNYSNLTNSHATTGWVEWKVSLPKAGKWHLHALFAAQEKRPCDLILNGTKQEGPILGEATGSWWSDTLKWFVYGPYDFKEGENVFRIQFAACMSHLKEFGFSPVAPPGQKSAGEATVSVLSFNGSSSYVDVADPFEDNTAFTISLWAKTSVLDDGAFHGLIGKQGDQYRKPGLWLCPSKGGLHYDSYSLSGERFGEALDGFFQKDKWTHVGWVKRGTTYEFYRDGRLFAERPAPPRFYTKRSSYWIGRVDNFWAGQIARARISSIALGEAAIRAEMRRDLGSNDAGLASSWPFDEGEGTTARDRAPSALHGAILGATWAKSAIPFVEPAPAAPAEKDTGPTWQSLAGSITDLVPGQHADGRLIVAARSAQAACHLISQTAPGASTWDPWASLEGGIKGRPALAAHADGRLYCGVIGMDDQLWSRQQTAPNAGNWTPYQHRPGAALADIVAIGNADGRIVVLARGKDDQLWHHTQTAPNADKWGAWEPLGGSLGGPPAVARTSKGRLEVFARGKEGDLWHIWQDAPGSTSFRPWHPLGGNFVGSPSVGQDADGRFVVFVRGTDEALWHIAQTEPNGLWGKWQSLGKGGSGGVSDPAVIAGAEGRLCVFARGKDGSVWSLQQTAPGGPFGPWTFLAGSAGPLAPARNADGKLELFTAGADSQLWHVRESAPGSGWA